jgi:hypothetical protein
MNRTFYLPFCCRSLLDTLLESLDASCTPADASQSDQKKEEVPSSSQTARILNLFAFLVNQTQATVKAAFLFLPQSGFASWLLYNINVIHDLHFVFLCVKNV